MTIRLTTRRALRWAHVWLGLGGSALILVMGLTGGIATLRPQAGTLLSPPAGGGISPETARDLAARANRTLLPKSPAPPDARPARCAASIDWNQAERDLQSVAGGAINRVYFPDSAVTGEFRVQFRMAGDGGKVFKHAIYDACAGKVLGLENLTWMDWIVDLHHNLRLSEATGRWVVGVAGVATLISAITGLLYWLLGSGTWKARVNRLLGLRPGQSGFKTTLDLHRLFGLAACFLLALGSFTGLCVTFPQNTRTAITWMSGVAIAGRGDVRSQRPKSKSAPAGLNELILAAKGAVPNGTLREIRFPDGGGPIQIRMHLPGDFRSTGNNVVSLDRTAKVTGVDLYAGKPFANRFYQSMAALHFGEWGEPSYRGLYASSGFAAALLAITGVFLWWIPRRHRRAVR